MKSTVISYGYICFTQRENVLKENKREHFQGAVISEFHFYELQGELA